MKIDKHNGFNGSADVIGDNDLREKILQRIKEIRILDIAVFIVPATQFIEMKIIGRLFAPDILLACMLPILLLSRRELLRERMPIAFIVFAIFWLSGQIVTDIVRETVFQDYMRGWSKIVFTLMNFCSLYLLIFCNKRRIFFYAIGLALGVAIKYFVNPGAYAEGLPWKFGYGDSVTWLLVFVASMAVSTGKYGSYLASIILAVAGVLNFLLGYRSLGGICLASSCYVLFQVFWGKRISYAYSSQRRAVVTAIALMVFGAGIVKMYSYSASSGLLGEDAEQRYEAQYTGKYGVLLGGRGELFVSSRAIMDSPILGHGSWAKNFDYSYLFNELRLQYGYATGDENEEGLIPTHSFLLGAWVEAGILGALFWVWVGSLPVRVLLGRHGKVDVLTPLIVFIAFYFIWDILFSPYGADRKFVTPYFIVCLMTYLILYNNKVQIQ